MKLFSILSLFALSFTVFGQEYQAPKPLPIAIQPDSLSIGKISVAWFCPEGFPLVAEKYEKMEIGIDIPTNLEQKISSFFDQKGRRDNQINPYNRYDITITAEFFRNGTPIDTRHAFFYEEFKKDLENNLWLKDTTSYPFRIRFAPPEVGLYQTVIKVNAKNFRTLTVSFDFQVEESENSGYLEIGKNGKHLRYSDSKSSFIGVGQDIPWTSWEDWSKLDKGVGPKRFEEIYGALNALEKASGNFTRFVVAPWFMQLEWEALGNYSPKQGHAWEFDRITEYCEENEIYYLFCGLLQSPLVSRTDEMDAMLPGVRWETYCYNDEDRTPSAIAAERPVGITKPIEFYSNPKAIDHVKNYYRYLVSRYGYSTSLAGWQLVSEVDETAEYRDELKDGKTIDHSANRNAVRFWTDDVSTYMRKELNDNHLISMAIINGKGYSRTFWDPELFNLPNIDFFGFHDYVYEQSSGKGKIRNRNLIVRYSTVNELNMGFQNDSISYPSYQNKVFIYDEFGHVLTVTRKYPEDDGIDPTTDFNNCADFMLKQDLWFTLSAGCAVAGLDWWNQDKPDRQAMWNKFYPGILEFCADIDFEKVDYTTVREVKDQKMITQRWPLTEKEIKQSNGNDYHKDDLLEAYIQLASDQTQGFGWMSNRSVNWYNMIEYYPCLKNMLNGTEPYAIPYLTKPEDADGLAQPMDIKDDTYFIKVYNLKRRTEYVVDFYNTLTGKKIGSRIEKTNGKGIMKMHAPEMKFMDDPDIGFKFLESGKTWK